MIGRKQVRILALLTLVLMGAAGIALLQLRGVPLRVFWSEHSLLSPSDWGSFFSSWWSNDFSIWNYFKGIAPLGVQIGMGLGLGLLASLLAHFILIQKFIENSQEKYKRVFRIQDLRWYDILFLSLSAGIGEELLFRGGIQFYLGIWITAFFFIAIHGYLNPKNWPIMVYGIFMSFAMVALGYATESYGIISAMIAHTFIDVYLLQIMKKEHAEEQRVKEKVAKEAFLLRNNLQSLVNRPVLKTFESSEAE